MFEKLKDLMKKNPEQEQAEAVAAEETADPEEM